MGAEKHRGFLSGSIIVIFSDKHASGLALDCLNLFKTCSRFMLLHQELQSTLKEKTNTALVI